MKTRSRLTKAAVLAEVNALRDRIRHLSVLTDDELLAEYNSCYPGISIPETDRGWRVEATRSMLLGATYHLTNVLNLE